MAKVNNTRKSDSWRPGMANGSGMISKNQKRKEKRYSHNLSTLKAQDTPTKKSLLGPLSKFKENLNQSLNLPAVGKKENKLLSTSLPIKADKKSTPVPKKNAKPTGILSNSNTPKPKGTKVTFNMEKNVDKFIDNEAEEGEEPITDKVVKPYVKGSQKRRMSMMDLAPFADEVESDKSDDSLSRFVDSEASEGEETDSGEDEEETSDDAFLSAGSEEDSDEEMESGEEEDDETDEEDSEEESEDESEEEMPVANSSRVAATPNRRDSMAAGLSKNEKPAGTPLTKLLAGKPDPVTPQSKKVDGKIESTPQSKNVKAAPESKKVVAETPAKGKGQATVEKKIQEKVVKDDNKEAEEKMIGEKSQFIGFIRKIFKKISLEDIKSALCKTIDAKKIVGLRLTRDRNVFVYLTDEDTLNSLLNHSFPVSENFKIVVYKARDSASEKKPKFVAFLPKVPLTITAAELKDAIVKHLGADCVETVQFRRVFKPMQTRNVLVRFTDVESLKKIVQKGELPIGSAKIVFRAAFETTVLIPTYRVLFTSIPEKTTEAMLKKAIESQVGQNTVQNIQFSQKKASFAFVTMRNEEAQKKALEVGKNVSVNGTKLQVDEFKPHQPSKKRAAPSEDAKERKKNKAKKPKLAEGATNNAPNHGKKNKKAAAALQKEASPKANIQKPNQTPSKGATIPTNAKKETAAGQQVVAKSKKKNKKFSKPGKGAAANAEPQSPVKGAKPKPEPQSPVKGAKPKPEPQSPVKGAKPKPETQSPANGPGTVSKRQAKKFKKGNAKPQSQSPVSVAVNGASPSSPKKKFRNKQHQQQSPKGVDAKKQALVAKIASKKTNKKNSMRRDAS